jgi:hypothetical protein
MDQDAREIRAEVDEARERVGETVEALVYKANAPKRLKDDAAAKAQTAKEKVTTTVGAIKRQASVRTENVKAKVDQAPSSNAATGTTTAAANSAQSESRRPRVESVISAIRRHPTATVAAAVGLATGITLGRITSR